MGDNFTAIDEVNPVAATGDLFNDVYEEFDAAIGNRSLLTTTDATAMADNIPLVTAIRRVYTQLVAAAGSITAITAAGWVTATRLAASVAGNGLSGGAGTALSVNVDDSTIEINSDTVRVKDAGITAAKLAAAIAGNGLAGGAGTALSVNTDGVGLEISGDALQLKNLGVAGAKIARDAFAPPNVFVDATFQTTPLKIAAEWGIWGHTSRWFPRSQSGLDDTAVLIFDDTNNPMGIRQRTVRFKGTSASTLFGWVISLAEAGWKATDTISGALYCNAPSGTFALDVRCAGPSGTLLGSLQTGVGQVMAGTPQILTISGATIDSGAAYVYFLASRTAGSSDLDLYWRYGGAGLLIPTVPSAQGYLPQMGVPRKQAADGKFLLPDYNAQANKILGADGTSQLDVGYLADSWGQRLIIAPVLRTWLQATYGDGGLGWVSFYITFAAAAGSTYWEGLAGGAGTVRTGTWTDSARLAGSLGPDITHIFTADSASTIKITTTVTFTAVDISLATAPGAGIAEYRLDGTGSWLPIDTDDVAGVIVEPVTGLGNTTHVIDIRVNTIAGGLSFLGLNLKKSGNGARLHRIAIGSSTAAHWTAVDAAIWQASITALALNTAIISLGTNDKSANTPPQTYGASMATLAQRVWAARSLTDVLFFSPCDVLNAGTTYTTAQQASALRTIASSLDTAYFDGNAVMPTNADAVTRGMMEPISGGISQHPTLYGGRLLANELISRMLKLV